MPPRPQARGGPRRWRAEESTKNAATLSSYVLLRVGGCHHTCSGQGPSRAKAEQYHGSFSPISSIIGSGACASVSLYERRSRQDAAALLDNGVSGCSLKRQCTTGPERRITRWSTSICSRPCRSALTRIRKPCVSTARRSNIRSAQQKSAQGCDALPDQGSSQGRSRNGARCPRLQSYPRHEHRRTNPLMTALAG